jgi:hypothetical protein
VISSLSAAPIEMGWGCAAPADSSGKGRAGRGIDKLHSSWRRYSRPLV